jgi:uncharacterized membrane protein YkoI
MKTTITTMALCLGIINASAQQLKEAEVPAKVKSAFAKKYPGSKVKEWEKEGADFEAEFDLNKVESSAAFGSDGTFIHQEQEMKVTELPKKALDFCGTSFVGFKLSEATKITTADGKVTYEAELLQQDNRELEAIFDDQGNFIKKSEPSQHDREKD